MSEVRTGKKLRLKGLNGVIHGHRGRAARTPEYRRKTADIFTHPAIDSRLVISPPQVSLELVHAAQDRHVDDTAKRPGRRLQFHDRTVDNRIQQARHGRPVLGLGNRTEELRHPEIPICSRIGHGHVAGWDLDLRHVAVEIPISDHVVHHDFLEHGMAGRLGSIFLRPSGDAAGEILRKHGSDRLEEVPAREFRSRVVTTVKRG